MMDIKEVTKVIKETLIKGGHPELASRVTVGVNPRLTSAMGRAFLGFNKIEMSKELMDRADDDSIYQTALHEACHLLVHAENKGKKVRPHGKEFKEMCKRVGCTHTGATNNFNFIRKSPSKGGYDVYCPECGGYHRHYKTYCKSVQTAKYYTCGGCGATLEVREV